ncbi:arginine--tRNA ligase [Nanoarchaeota archaeon]
MNKFEEAIRKGLKEARIDNIELEVPPDSSMGDYAFPCFALSKKFKKSPNEIAQDLARKIKLSTLIKRIEIKGPYLNFFINKAKLAQATLENIYKNKEKYGSGPEKKDNILVEYSGPNSNKPLHVGHIRNNVLGMALGNILKFNGHKTVLANLVNDRGVHICKSMLAYQKWGKNEKPKGKPDHFVGKYYQMFSKKANEKLEKENQELLNKWEAKDPETIKIWRKMNDWAIKGMKETYKRMGTKFDVWYMESDFFDKADLVLNLGVKKGLFVKDETGAIVADLEKHGLPNKTVLRADGTSIYLTNDLALTPYKYESNDITKATWVVGSAQNLYFKQLFKILDLLGYKWAKNCHHFSHGMVYLPEGKMSSREGTVVNADDLIDKVVGVSKKEIKRRHKDLSAKEIDKRAEIIGLAAIKFYMLRIDAHRDTTFDWDKALDFEGETGTYLLYTYARAGSVLRKSKKKASVKVKFDLLEKDVEQKIIDLLEQFPSVVQEAANYKPALVSRYLVDLSQAFNEFYHSCQILKEEKDLKEARLLLTDSVKQVLSNGLGLLGIETIEKM